MLECSTHPIMVVRTLDIEVSTAHYSPLCFGHCSTPGIYITLKKPQATNELQVTGNKEGGGLEIATKAPTTVVSIQGAHVHYNIRLEA